ncbi:hypothetical protein FRC01_009920, partial [Tulasnella sp. 417]
SAFVLLLKRTNENFNCYNFSCDQFHSMKNAERGLRSPLRIPSPRETPSDGLKLTAELPSEQCWRKRTKLDELAQWQIDRSSLKFPKGAPEFHGNYGSVFQALLAVSYNREDGTNESANLREEVESRAGRLGKSSSGFPKSEGDGDVGRKKQGNREPRAGMRVPLWSRIRGLKIWGLGGGGSSPSRSSDQAKRTVAVKKMKISGDSERILALTLREARFLVELSHPNIINLEGFVEDIRNDMIWLVFPWADNGSLRDFGAMINWEIPERIALISDVTTGVEYLHSRKPPIRHGDLKSINILVNSENRALITDFGSARRITTKDIEKERERTEKTSRVGLRFEAVFCASTNSMTLTGDKFTLRWAAPELLHGDEAGLWSDIWALGWVAYEVMTNSIPFEGVGDAKVIINVIRGDLPSISEDTRLLLIRALCSLMIECWSVDPGKRPTAEECRKAIGWMASYVVPMLWPRAVPNPKQRGDTAGRMGHSPKLLVILGEMHMKQGDYANASKYYTEALGAATNITDMAGKASALLGLAGVHRLQNEFSEAANFYSQGLQINIDIGDKNGQATSLFGLAEVYRNRNDYSKAINFYSQCLRINTDIGDE